MEDFFKQFRENLENRPEPDFEERDWQDMQARLERDKPMAWAWWWFAVPCMLLLTGSNAFFFGQWKKAEQKISSLEIRRDTVFHTRVIHTTDTVFRTRVLREWVVEFPTNYAQNPPNIFGGKNGLSVSFEGGTENQLPLNSSLQVLESLKPSESPEQTGNGERLLQNTSMLPLDNIQHLYYRHRPIRLPDYEVFVPAKKQKRGFFDHLHAAQPKDFQLGAMGGFAYPYGNGVNFKSGYSIGLRGALEFSPKLRLWADAAYYKTLFLTDRMSDDIGVPIEDPPSSEYVFLQAEVPQPFFQYSAGMQYLFRTKHRLRPMVGLGLGAISLLPYDVIYEFENTTLGVEWDLDKPVQRQGRGLITNFLVLPVGLEYGFSKHWNAQIQANYRYNWKGTGVQSPNMLGIQGGLNYRF